MSQLQSSEEIDGLHVRFPSNGPATSSTGKLFTLLFWGFCAYPALIGTNYTLWSGALITAVVFLMLWLAARSGQLRLQLSDTTVRLSSPRFSHIVRLDDIDAVDVRKASNMSRHYVVLVSDGEEITVDVLLKKADADWLAAQIEQARQARALIGEDEPVEVPAELQALRAAAAPIQQLAR